MTSQYLPVIALLVLSVLFAAISFVASRLLAPRSPNDRKQAPYECGIIPAAEDPNERFPVCLLYTSPSPRDVEESRMPSSA